VQYGVVRSIGRAEGTMRAAIAAGTAKALNTGKQSKQVTAGTPGDS
jgi:hypothetical protein